MQQYQQPNRPFFANEEADEYYDSRVDKGDVPVGIKGKNAATDEEVLSLMTKVRVLEEELASVSPARGQLSKERTDLLVARKERDEFKIQLSRLTEQA